jgi:hypothetical protein
MPHYAMPSHNVKYVPGDVNAIRHNTITKIVNINSTFREEMVQTLWPNGGKDNDHCFDPRRSANKKKYKSTDFIIRLPTALDKVVSMKLSSLEIPNTGYVLSSELKNNIFQLTVRSLDGDLKLNNGKYTIEIISGNYTVDDLCEYINKMFADASLWPANKPMGIIVRANETYGRFYFVRFNTRNKNDNLMEFDIDFSLPNESRDIRLNLGWMLGFRKCFYNYMDDYNDGADWPYNDSFWPAKTIKTSIMYKPDTIELCPEGIIGEGVIDLTGPKYLFLVVNDFNNSVNNKYTSVLENAMQIPASNILARISMQHASNEVGFDDTSDQIQKSREYFGPVTIDKLHIKVIDEYGRIINLNNNDISMLLEFECIYNL